MLVASAVAAVALGLVACDNGDPSDALPTTTTERRSTASSSTTTASATDTTAPQNGDEQQVIDQYLGFWEARFAANQEPVNPDHPSLREYATGAQLDNVIEETRRRRDEGLAFRWPEDSVHAHDVTVAESSPTEVILQDCSVNDGIIYRVATGEVVDDDVVTQNIRATMQLVEGVWKLARATLVQEWEGVAGCASTG